LKGRHLLQEEECKNMVGCEALTTQLQDALHGGVQFAVARVGFLPLALDSAKRGSASSTRTQHHAVR
jgi:hypothetical protein